MIFVGLWTFGSTPRQIGLAFGAPAFFYFAKKFLSSNYSERFGVGAIVFGEIFCTLFTLLPSFIMSFLRYGLADCFFSFINLVEVNNINDLMQFLSYRWTKKLACVPAVPDFTLITKRKSRRGRRARFNVVQSGPEAISMVES